MINRFSVIRSDNRAVLKEALVSGAFIVDVRTPEEVIAGGVDGAVNIPTEEVPERLSEFEDKSNIIVFCRSGARSLWVKQFLKQHGFQNIFNGGRWQDMADLIDETR